MSIILIIEKGRHKLKYNSGINNLLYWIGYLESMSTFGDRSVLIIENVIIIEFE